MQTSEQTNELMEALSKAQGAFSNIKATRVNPFHKSKYAPLDEVIKMYRPILAKNDLAITHGTYHMNFEDGAKAFLKTRLSHKSGQWIEDDGAPLLVRSTDKNGNPVARANPASLVTIPTRQPENRASNVCPKAP